MFALWRLGQDLHLGLLSPREVEVRCGSAGGGAGTEAFLRQLAFCSSLRVRGLMTLAVFAPDPERVRGCFALMRGLRNRIRQESALAGQVHELSMGMSGDFEIAIGEGATVIRVDEQIVEEGFIPKARRTLGKIPFTDEAVASYYTATDPATPTT